MTNILQRFKSIGPGAIVAAAFIGPGTIATATLSGAGYGYALLWAIAFSVLATFVLQEMSARLGLIGKLGLGEAIRTKVQTRILKLIASVLVIGAVLIGNAAYEAGNITGAVLGFDRFFEDFPLNPLVFLIGVSAFFLLYSGQYKLIERTLVVIVGLMSAVFFISAVLLQPNILGIAKGLFVPSLPQESLLLVIGLIGTTVVPYNLFLHASAVKQKWSGPEHLRISRGDTLISILVGGLITMCVVVTSAAAFHGTDTVVESASDLSNQLRPILGSSSEIVIALGFMAAGLSSAITAPLAAAFATSGILGWKEGMSGKRFKIVWIFVLLVGLVFSSVGFKPIKVILFAQVANGLLLPIIALFLLWIMNDKTIMGRYANSILVNILAMLVVGLTIVLGAKSILSALNIL
ncbi:MAG: Nramp family divalent metal transporter [Cyclobacteriaceae bacterium]